MMEKNINENTGIAACYKMVSFLCKNLSNKFEKNLFSDDKNTSLFSLNF